MIKEYIYRRICVNILRETGLLYYNNSYHHLHHPYCIPFIENYKQNLEGRRQLIRKAQLKNPSTREYYNNNL